MKTLAYTALVRQILEYGTVYWDRNKLGQLSPLNRVQKRADKFANNINDPDWVTLGQRIFKSEYATFSRHEKRTSLEGDSLQISKTVALE